MTALTGFMYGSSIIHGAIIETNTNMRKIPDRKDAHRCSPPLPPFLTGADEVRISFPNVLTLQFKSFISI
jgi:hypothetical protein